MLFIYTLAQDALYPSARQDSFGSYIGADVCLHSPESVNSCECETEEGLCYVVLLQQYGLVLVNMCNLECYLNFYDGSKSD